MLGVAVPLATLCFSRPQLRGAPEPPPRFLAAEALTKKSLPAHWLPSLSAFEEVRCSCPRHHAPTHTYVCQEYLQRRGINVRTAINWTFGADALLARCHGAAVPRRSCVVVPEPTARAGGQPVVAGVRGCVVVHPCASPLPPLTL